MQQFDHEKLEVFNASLDFVVAAEELARSATRGQGHAELADQLRRASTSIVSNIGEGAGEFVSREKARFYRLSKRSATECAALVEIFRRKKLIADEETDAARALLLRIVPMLVRLIHVTEAQNRRSV